MHARASARAFVGDDDHVSALDLAAEDAFARRLLRVEDLGGAGELPYLLIDTGGLDDAAVLGDVTEEDTESAILGVGVLEVADALGLRMQTCSISCLRVSPSTRLSEVSTSPPLASSFMMPTTPPARLTSCI